ncbi:MAG TPA: ABC transporter permease [Azospirillaceae bacterium]|nr:ABC transporter permease [Azospirillaceae bacterium]
MRLSAPARRRWARFRANRRGWWSLWLLLALVLPTLPAEFVANDRPLLVRFDGGWYSPVLHDYPETDFGGDFPTAADYRDPYVAALIGARGWMLWPPLRYAYDSVNYALPGPAPSPPSRENWLGTDDQGRDVVARLVYGIRLSVLFGAALTVAASAIGILAGAVQGYFGGWVDLAGQRLVEVWSGLPVLFILILLASLVEPGFWWLLGVLLLFGWMPLVGAVRTEALRVRRLDHVRAARALGASEGRILLRHVLPNATVAALALLPFVMGGAITTLSALDFLGFGLPPGSPSLGELLAQGKAHLHAPWLGVTAFAALAVLLSLLVFVGEAARDAFDPRG